MGDIRRASAVFREDRGDVAALQQINAYRRFRLNCIRTSLSLLDDVGLPSNVLVSARLKRLRSIQRKMVRSRIRGIKAPVNEMDDIIGFRVICSSPEVAEGFAARVSVLPRARTKNYLHSEHAAGLGYRAVHGIVRFDQPLHDNTVTVRFEIQIRTWYQHLWACWCESYGEHAKEGFPNWQQRVDHERVSQVIAELRAAAAHIRELEVADPTGVQKTLPAFAGAGSVALSWMRDGYFSFEPFWADVQGAAARLEYLEGLRETNPLLLVGVTNRAAKSELRALLTDTHPNVLSAGNLHPRYWLPGFG